MEAGVGVEVVGVVVEGNGGKKGRWSSTATEALLNVKRCVKLIAGEACAVC